MRDLINTVEESRAKASKIMEDSLLDLTGFSELQIRDKFILGMKEEKDFFPLGWYDPPFGGVGVLFDTVPYKRLQFDSLRKQEFFPNENNIFTNESVGIFYLSPVDRETGMIGDIGLTIYNGSDEKIKKHVRDCYELLLEVANQTEVGMSFSDLYLNATNLFKEKKQKVIAWMSTNVWKATNNEKLKINLGHTVLGSFGDRILGSSFEETRENIRTKRIFIDETETFVISSTCAFTLEARLTDEDQILPNVFFHFMVTFKDGKRTVLSNLEDVFKKVRMDYML